jgi:outer membrane protein OmpA-like peptidoglycan-associated protein
VIGDSFSYDSYNNETGTNRGATDLNRSLPHNKSTRVSVWVQGSRIRLYALGAKVFDVQNGIFKDYKYQQIRFNSANSDVEFLISNLRIAAATEDQRSKFLIDGKLISYGILFDVNSDKVKPESYGAIKEMADILKENPAIIVKVVGHTDSDGDDSKNLQLSKNRAASVKNELVNTFGIDASRIETDGKGETEPVEPNTTPMGKSKNRRVEFIKL